MKTLQELKEQYGTEGVQELVDLDRRAAELIDRLYKLTCIAVNLRDLEVESGKSWFNAQSRQINMLMDESDATMQLFNKKYGEL